MFFFQFFFFFALQAMYVKYFVYSHFLFCKQNVLFIYILLFLDSIKKNFLVFTLSTKCFSRSKLFISRRWGVLGVLAKDATVINLGFYTAFVFRTYTLVFFFRILEIRCNYRHYNDFLCQFP